MLRRENGHVLRRGNGHALRLLDFEGQRKKWWMKWKWKKQAEEESIKVGFSREDDALSQSK